MSLVCFKLFFSDPGEGSISEEIERIDKAIADIDQTIQKADQKGGEQGRTESNIQGPILNRRLKL